MEQEDLRMGKLNKLINWFYTTRLGNLYFEFLLWRDRQNDRASLRYLTPKEIQQIVRQYSILGEGVKEVKGKVNKLVESRTKEEYDKVLREIEDMVSLAERDTEDPKAQFVTFLKSRMDLTPSDIKSVTDRAKMVERRINDMKELQDHKVKRDLIKSIRKAKKDNNLELADKLEQEFKEKYGRA